MSSSLDRIRARRAELERKQTIDLIIPGYEGQFGARYRILSDDELDKLLKGVDGREVTISKGIESTLDVLIAACECLLVIPDDGEQFEPLTNDEGVPYRYETALAEELGFEAETARQVVRGVFSPEGTQPLAAGAHGQAITAWMQGDADQIDKALLGE